MERKEAILMAGRNSAQWLPNLNTIGFDTDAFERLLEGAGFVVAPKEPIQEQVQAAADYYQSPGRGNPGWLGPRGIFAMCYRAMIGARGR